MHRCGEWVYGVLNPPSQEEGVAGNTGVDECDRVSFDLYHEVLEDGVLAVGFICAVGGGVEGVALQSDRSVAHELQLQFICLEWTEGDFGAFPKGAVEPVVGVVVEDTRVHTKNSHDPEGHSCQFRCVEVSVRKTA